MVQRIFLYFFDKKREGLAFERLKFASSTTGTSATRGAVKLKSASPLTTGYIAERQKQKTDSHCESVLFRNLLPVPSNKPL